MKVDVYRLKNRRIMLGRVPGGDWIVHFKRLENKKDRIINETKLRLSNEAITLIAYHVAYGAVKGEWILPDSVISEKEADDED